jgi:ArsR family metal-binding transcriptional regulator
MMPGKNCGICGSGSCTTFLRKVIFEKESLNTCAWLNNNEIGAYLLDVTPVKTKVQTLAIFNPCITDADLVMAEVYLAPHKVDYGYIDPLFCDMLPLYFEHAKCSKVLGIGRIEYEDKEVLISQTGKVVVRHAQNERDALEVCSLLSRIVSGAVICPSLCTAIECISGLCTCEDCTVKAMPLRDTLPYTLLGKAYTLLGEAFSRVWEGDLITVPDSNPLKRRALAQQIANEDGLALYAAAHHFSLIKEAITDAVHWREPVEKEMQHTITQFVQGALTGAYDSDAYQTIVTFLREHDAPFFKEMYKAVFHSALIAHISLLYGC